MSSSLRLFIFANMCACSSASNPLATSFVELRSVWPEPNQCSTRVKVCTFKKWEFIRSRMFDQIWNLFSIGQHIGFKICLRVNSFRCASDDLNLVRLECIYSHINIKYKIDAEFILFDSKHSFRTNNLRMNIKHKLCICIHSVQSIIVS